MDNMTIEQLAQKVKDTRDAQKRYFKAVRQGLPDKYQALDESKMRERELDETVDRILSKPSAVQTDLFR